MSVVRHLSFALALSLGALYAAPASAESSFYGSSCASCHGSSPSTCNGCHQHAGSVSGSISKTTFAPGESMTFTVRAGSRTGWWRAAVLDASNRPVQTASVASGTSATLSVPAPAAAGTYAYKVAWYGNERGGSGGSTWFPDAGNPGHGYRAAAATSFTVAAPAAATVALNPGSLSFGNVNVGATSSLTAQVRNTGTGPLTVTGIQRCASPATSGEYTWSPTALPITIAAGASANLAVSYAPTAAGSDTGCIALTTNASNGPTTNLAVSGTGVVPAAPRIAVSPTSLSFGNVTIGNPTPRTFTISNTGTAALTGTVARASGTSAEYAASPASFNLAAGASQVVTVTYGPTGTGADAGALTVASNDAASPTVSVSLSGTGVAAPSPNIALSPVALPFGTVTVGGSASRAVQVQNTGTAPLAVTQVARCASPATSAEFTWSPAGPFTVAAGGSTTVTVAYAPTAAGADAGCLAFSSDDPADPVVSLDVSGTGQAAAAPRVAVSPSSLAFGNVTLGTSGARTFTISNTGNATLTGSVARASATSAEYAVSPASFSVAAGSSETVTVTYAPAGVGADAGAVVVTSNDPVTSSVQVGLSGAGVAAPTPAIALSPTSLSFGTVTLGGAASLTAQIRNAGSATLNVSAIAPCAGTSGEFTFASAASLAIAPGQSAALAVTYRPTAAGADSGCLALASDDPASPTVNLGLSGTGAEQAVPAIALDPAAVDFGTVLVGSAASRTATVRNTGNARLDVTVSRCSGTPDAFGWSPAAPLSVEPGQSAIVTTTFAPTAAATSSGCLALASNDPARPRVELALAGAGSQPPVPSADADVDIDELRVPRRLSRSAQAITPRIELVNRSRVAGAATVRLTGSLDGAQVYDQSLPVTIPAREHKKLAFPPYPVAAATTGKIHWKATVADQDADVDEATATTWLGRTRLVGSGDDGASWYDRRDDDEDDDDRDGRDGRRDLVAAPEAGSGGAGGCSSAGGGAGFAALTALGLAVLRRRRA